jgi:hypothetical protein
MNSPTPSASVEINENAGFEENIRSLTPNQGLVAPVENL